MKQTVFPLGIFVLGLVVGAGPPEVRAQVGQVGMGTAELRVRLGPPHRVEAGAQGQGTLFTSYDALWCYDGRDAGTAFCYALADSVVFSTTALVAFAGRPAAVAAVERFAEEMEGKGWRTEQLDAHDYLFHADAAIFRLSLLAEAGGYRVVRTHAARLFVGEAAGTYPPPLLSASSPSPAAGAAGAAPPRPPEEAARDTASVEEASVREEPTARDTSAAEPEPEVPPPAPQAAQASRGLDPARGGYTWVVASTTDRQEAERVAGRYRERGFAAGILRAERGGTAFYRVGLGQYPTREALYAARPSLPADVPDDMWPLRLTAGM